MATISENAASQFAVRDFAGLETGARYALMGAMTEADDFCICILDGSQYSPSWRALNFGAAVYDAGDGEDCQIYDETLEELMSDWSGRHDATMFWNDGCIFVAGAEFDFEEIC